MRTQIFNVVKPKKLTDFASFTRSALIKRMDDNGMYRFLSRRVSGKMVSFSWRVLIRSIVRRS